FFSSRRRHTRSKRDWSSDVCSSDLSGQDKGVEGGFVVDNRHGPVVFFDFRYVIVFVDQLLGHLGNSPGGGMIVWQQLFAVLLQRSEERRVGKEWGCRWGWQE